MSQHQITADELAHAMSTWVLLVTHCGAGRKGHLVGKRLWFCPGTGEFRITADGRSAQLFQNRNAAIAGYNATRIGDLAP